MKVRALLVSLVVFATACSSLPAKQIAVQSNKLAGQSIWALQDTERRICNQASFDKDPLVPITECTGPLATAATLTTAKHQEFAKVLTRAYQLRIRVDFALLAWQPGQPAPTELPSLQQAADEALKLARALTQTNEQRELVTLADTVVTEVRNIVNALRN